MNQDSELPLGMLRVDGGMTQNNLLLELQADILGIPVGKSHSPYILIVPPPGVVVVFLIVPSPGVVVVLLIVPPPGAVVVLLIVPPPGAVVVLLIVPPPGAIVVLMIVYRLLIDSTTDALPLNLHQL